MKINDIQKQRSEWKRKGWSIPELRGGKQEWFNIVVELIRLIGGASIADISASPILKRKMLTFLIDLDILITKVDYALQK